ncbi:MAG: hypothetical protein PHU24_08695 [Sphaerochaetaceae bacterium]|jgi:hypothetical protein|nr:hypothetical protein [Sphaerochaetaceae bacterium]MDD4259025.1 hypothetical protein [Sphaerochaetaceae bacterium]MDD5075676.1 hypothetical protein [Sphaerochaetaceae bacterium]
MANPMLSYKVLLGIEQQGNLIWQNTLNDKGVWYGFEVQIMTTMQFLLTATILLYSGHLASQETFNIVLSTILALVVAPLTGHCSGSFTNTIVMKVRKTT